MARTTARFEGGCLKGRALWVLRAMGVVLFAWLVGRANWSELARVLGGVNTTLLYALPPLTALMVAFRAWRWNQLLAVRDQALPYRQAWGMYAIGLFLGSITPGRLGDLAKAWYVHGEGMLDWDQALAGALADRLFDVGFMGILACWAIFQLGLAETWLTGEIVQIIGTGMGFALLTSGIADIKSWLSARKGIAFLLALKDEIAQLLRAVGVRALILTALAYSVYFAQTLLMAEALGLALAPRDMIAAIVLVGIAAFLPVSVAGFGTREGLLALIFAHRAIPNSLEMALAFSGLFFAFCFVVPALMGFACWLKNPLSLSDLKASAVKP